MTTSIFGNGIAFNIPKEQLIGRWRACGGGYGYEVTLFVSSIQKESIKALVETPMAPDILAPSQVKCGILGLTPHAIFIQKISGLAQETISENYWMVLHYDGIKREIWIFEKNAEKNCDEELSLNIATLKTLGIQRLFGHLQKLIYIQETIGNQVDNLKKTLFELVDEKTQGT